VKYNPVHSRLASRARELSADPRTQTGALIASFDGAVALSAVNRPVAAALLALSLVFIRALERR
jgi:hypothetical protein